MFKALWVRDEEPDVVDGRNLDHAAGHLRAPARRAGELAVDYSNASSLALLDPRTRTWSSDVLDATGIDPAMLPALGPGTEAVGTVTAAFAEATGPRPVDGRRDRVR